jgi:glycosyltransferase involved in cell wall biosynthesis
MKRVLYLIHLPWGWVKQRFHFIAEGLTEYFDVRIIYEKQYIYKHKLVHHERTDNLTIQEVFKLPYVASAFFLKLNSAIVRYQLRKIIDGYDFVWLTHPNLFDRIDGILPKRIKVIYDCMDDYLEFSYVKSHPRFFDMTFENEKALIKASDIVFSSSASLKRKLCERYGSDEKIYVVNNGISLDESASKKVVDEELSAKVAGALNMRGTKIVYIGGISDWVDFDLLLASLEACTGINYLLFGPSEIKIPEHERLLHLGPIQHKYVFAVMERADALVMPFKVNELILSVNPVKLYEYIYSCKPSIAVKYGETEQFSDYVYLYSTREEYIELINQITRRRLSLKTGCEECKRFAMDNIWKKRAEKIREIMTSG